MDSIFHPQERLWISQEIVLGDTISRLNDKYQVFFSDLEEVRRENPSLFKPLEASRPSQEELAALLKPYDYVYDKPKKSKNKNKANSDDNDIDQAVEPEILVEDQEIIDVDSSSDISDSEIKLQLVSLDIDDGHGNCTVVANPDTNTTVLLDSDEGEDFFTDFGHFKSSLYTNYTRDLKKRSRKRVKNPIDCDGFDGESTDTDTDEDYEFEEIFAESGESDTDGENMDSGESESDEEIKIDDENKQKNGVSVDIFGTKPGKKEICGDSDGRKVDLNGAKINNNNVDDGPTGGRPRRSVAAYALTALDKVKVKSNANCPVSGSSQVKNEKVSTVSVPPKPKLKSRPATAADVYAKDGQLPGTSSSDATPQPGTSRPGPSKSKSKSTNVYIHDGQVAGPSSSILKKNSSNLPSSSKTKDKDKTTKKKNVTISDDKKDKGPKEQGQNPEEEAVKREMVSFMNFFENSYKAKLAELKNWLMDDREAFKKAYKVDDKGFKEMQRAINPSLVTIPEEFLMDSPIMKLGSMPVLYGPVPFAGLKKSAVLAMLKFANLGRALSHEDWYWKSPIVLDQMTMDQEVTDRILRTRESKLRQGEEIRKPLGIRNPNLVDKDDFIVTIRVYQNFKNDDIVADQFNLNLEPKFLYEIQILGSQTLAELRQMLTCENDYVCLESFAHPHHYDPEDETKFAKNCYNGSIICIGNKLYVDPENEHSELMARSVIDWGKANKAGKLGPFQMTSLFDTKIKDLVIRFGYPYVFIHLGNCEHLLVFTTSKVISSEDRLEKSLYPRRSVYGKFRIINCNIDNENMAKWAVIGCDRFPSSQMMICGDCLLTYCYDAEDKKIGDFHLFPIINIAGKI